MDAEALSALKYNDLRALAKQHNIKANSKSDQIISALVKHFEDNPPSLSRPTRSTRQSVSAQHRPEPTSNGRASSRNTRGASRRPSHAAVSEEPQQSRSRSRVISTARPRAALNRASVTIKPATVEEEDEEEDEPSEDDEEESVGGKKAASPSPRPPPASSKVKAKESQKRLGVGRPTLAGGSGARKSTAKAKTPSMAAKPRQIVEVVIPSMRMSRVEPTGHASGSAAVNGTNVRASSTAMSLGGLTTLTRNLQDRLDKTDSILAEERRKVAALQDENQKLATENQKLATEVDRVKEFVGLPPLVNGAADAAMETSETQGKGKEKEIDPPEENDGLSDPVAPIETDLTSRPTTPRAEPGHADPPELSPFPPTPPSMIMNAPPSRPQSRGGSRPGSPRVGAQPATQSTQPLMKTAINRARALSNQPSGRPSPGPSVQAIQGDAAANRPGKRGRETREGSVASNATGVGAGPNKKMRVQEDDAEGEMDTDGALNGGPAVAQPGQASPAIQPVLAATAVAVGQALLTAETPVGTRRSRNIRALSQPPRPRGNSRASVEPVVNNRRTRAGSADVAAGVRVPMSRTGRGGLAAVPEQSSAPDTIPGPSNGAGGDVGAADSGEPPLLQPLTMFDSGNEFYGSVSKQGYRTDWHDGTVFDDPIDAETIRRGQALVAEEIAGGRFLNPPSAGATEEVEGLLNGDLGMPHAGMGMPGLQHQVIPEEDEEVMRELVGYGLPHTGMMSDSYHHHHHHGL